MLESTRFYDPSGDIFLQTQPDQSVFQISSALLSLVSDVFADMFVNATANTPPEGKDSSHPINLEHDGEVFNAVCQVVYPGENPPLHEDLPLLVKCITFAEKYELSTLIPIFQDMLCHPYLLDAQPFHVYGLACDFGWMQVKDRAAKATLIYDVDNIRTVPGFGNLTAQDYHDLVSLHRLKAEKMRSVLRILASSRYLAPGIKCIPNDAVNAEEEFHYLKDKRAKRVGAAGLKPAPVKPGARRIPPNTKITLVPGSGKPITGSAPPAIAAPEQVPDSCQITVSHFWEAKRCKCNAQPSSTDVADQDYDSITPQWLQHFLAEANYVLLPVPTLEKVNRVFAHNAGVRSALNTLCVACPVNAREHSPQLLQYKKEMMKAFQVE
jgi:hypothetical protein